MKPVDHQNTARRDTCQRLLRMLPTSTQNQATGQGNSNPPHSNYPGGVGALPPGGGDAGGGGERESDAEQEMDASEGSSVTEPEDVFAGSRSFFE